MRIIKCFSTKLGNLSIVSSGITNERFGKRVLKSNNLSQSYLRTQRDQRPTAAALLTPSYVFRSTARRDYPQSRDSVSNIGRTDQETCKQDKEEEGGAGERQVKLPETLASS